MRRRESRERRSGHHPFGALIVLFTFGAAISLAGCATSAGTVPGCGDPLRLAIVAQSVPSAAYLPCLRDLRPGWTASGFAPSQAGTSFLLDSDRSPGRPVTVRLTASCRISGASPSPARAPGALTYTRLESIRPRFAGHLYDVFPGGCVTYTFDFRHGSQIALTEEFETAVGLYPQQQLRLELKRKLGVELNP
ncbi:MAG TPA: hypothetical protein VFW50_24120 [Streptosporangiaceae bacterium]|nr:hypothetical protein [Streptosporangiaceae bacterium]